jgi:hypothetical protein
VFSVAKEQRTVYVSEYVSAREEYILRVCLSSNHHYIGDPEKAAWKTLITLHGRNIRMIPVFISTASAFVSRLSGPKASRLIRPA